MNDIYSTQALAVLRRIADELTLLRQVAERLAPPQEKK